MWTCICKIRSPCSPYQKTFGVNKDLSFDLCFNLNPILENISYISSKPEKEKPVVLKKEKNEREIILFQNFITNYLRLDQTCEKCRWAQNLSLSLSRLNHIQIFFGWISLQTSSLSMFTFSCVIITYYFDIIAPLINLISLLCLYFA